MTTEDERIADTAGAGFLGSVGVGDSPCLVVVDVCRAYLDPESSLSDTHGRFEAARASTARLVDEARGLGVPVLFTQMLLRPGLADAGFFARKVPALKMFEVGSPMADFPSSPAPLAEEIVVTKQYASAFFGTTLAPTLRSMGVDTVYVTGFSTSGCVRATALDALQHGFRPRVVADACGDRDPVTHDRNLFDLDAKYADVITEADATTELRAFTPS